MRTLIPLVFLLLAAWFLVAPAAPALPFEERVVAEAGQLSTDPVRSLRPDLDEVLIGGVQQRCTDCHDIFDSLEEPPEHLRQHTEIVLDHGMNDRCLNCHARDSRGMLELHGGEKVPMTESALLCAKCHGPTYRDWERGTHGRTNGSWVTGSPDMARLLCIECHDPHAPAFPGIVPLPAPRAWRVPLDGGGHGTDGGASAEHPIARWPTLQSQQAFEHATDPSAPPVHEGGDGQDTDHGTDAGDDHDG